MLETTELPIETVLNDFRDIKTCRKRRTANHFEI
jgi:hypothetical protein